MPTIPGYDAQRNIKAGPMAPFRDEAIRPYQDNKVVLDAVEGVTQKWKEAHDVGVENNFKLRKAIGLAEIENEEANDTGITYDSTGKEIFTDNSNTYFEKIKKLDNELLATVDDAQLRSRLEADSLIDSTVSSIKISSSFKKKELKFIDLTSTKELDRLTGILISGNENEKIQAQIDVQSLLNRMVKSNVWSVEQAEKKKNSAFDTVVEYKIYDDESVQEVDSTLLADLKDPEGPYKNFPQQKRLELIKKLQTRIERNGAFLKKKTQNELFQSRIGFFKSVISGEMDPMNPAVILDIQRKDPQLGNILEKQRQFPQAYLMKSGVAATVNVVSAANSIRNVYEKSTEEQLNKYLEDQFRGMKGTSSDLELLGIHASMAAAQYEANKQKIDNPEVVADHNALKGIFDFFSRYFPQNADEATVEMMRRKERFGTSGEELEKEKSKVMLKILNDIYPETNGLPGIPNYVIDEFGLDNNVYEGPNELTGEQYAPTESDSRADFSQESSE